MTDVRKRIQLQTRYELRRRRDGMIIASGQDRDFGMGETPDEVVVAIRRWRVGRPVVTETRWDQCTRYNNPSGTQVTMVSPPSANDMWTFFHPTEYRHHYFSTRAEAERACRKHLRSIGYRVARAKEGS